MSDTNKLNNSSNSLRVPYDSLTLRAVVKELQDALIGGQVQDVRQPVPTEVQLGIRNHGRNHLLVLSADAQFARAHLTANRRANAPTPPAFCMALRKRLETGWVTAVRQRDFDRILEMEVSHKDEAGEVVSVTLIAELMGKHSNLILVNSEGTILEAAKRISKRINRVRETLPGLAYQPPPEQPDRSDPFAPGAVEKITRELGQIPSDNPQALAEALLQIYTGMSPFLAREIALRAQGPSAEADRAAKLHEVWEQIFGQASRGSYSPVLVGNTMNKSIGAYPFPLAQASVAQQQSAPNLNEALDTAYTAIIERTHFDAIHTDLRARIDREIKRLERQRQSVARGLEEAQRAEGYRQAGELLLANLWRIHPGDSMVTVQDYFDPELHDRQVELDPKRTPQENAESYFQRYRKARDSQEKERQRGEQIDADLQRLGRARTELARLATVEAVQSLRDELVRKGLLRANEVPEAEETRPAGPDFQGHKIRRYLAPEGYEIYVGESATANDFLTTRVAAPNDLWLHVRAAVSAHVIIRTHGSPDRVPRAVIQRAAEICAQHSVQKHSTLVSVDYTLKKYVRKPRGAPPGAADYEKETTIDVTPKL